MPISDDPYEDCAIAPNQILINRINTSLYGIKFDEKDVYGKHIWKLSQVYADNFWRRWIKEYRPELLKRNKWFDDRNHEQISVGDIVLLVDETMSRGSWPKGVVQHCFYGKDKKVRSMEIKTKQGVLKRPITKVIILTKEKHKDEISNEQFSFVVGEY